MIWATVSFQSCFCWLYRASPSLAAKNKINLITMLTIWWCPCVESSLVLLEESVCYDWCWSWNSKTLEFRFLSDTKCNVIMCTVKLFMLIERSYQSIRKQCKELTHWKRPWCWERLGAGEEGDDRGWDGWMAWPAWWTWVWVNSGSWWWTGRPGVLRFMGSQRVGHDWETELNWCMRYCLQCDSKAVKKNF